jgi:hypothetical protein
LKAGPDRFRKQNHPAGLCDIWQRENLCYKGCAPRMMP